MPARLYGRRRQRRVRVGKTTRWVSRAWLPVLILVGMLAVGQVAMAATGSVWLEGSHDSADTDSYNLDLTLGMNTGATLLAGVGGVHAASSVTGGGSGQGALDTRSWYVGIASDNRVKTRFGLRYAYWGHAGELETRALKLSLGYYPHNWSWRLLPELRRITIYTDTTLRQKEGTLDSTGLGGEVAYYGFGNLFWRASAYTYSYARDPAVLATRRAAYVFSSATLALSQGFLDHSTRLELGYSFRPADVSLVGSRYVSAIDGSTSTAYAVTSTVYQFEPVEFSLEGGTVHDEGSGSTTHYASLGLGYNW